MDGRVETSLGVPGAMALASPDLAAPIPVGFAVVFLILGLFVLFFGRKLAKATLAIVGFLFGAIVGAGVGLAFAGPVGALAGLVIGGIVGAILVFLTFAFAAIVLGAIGGFVLGQAIASAFTVASPWPLVWGVVGAVVGGGLGAFARDALLVVATSLIGAQVLVGASVILADGRVDWLDRPEIQLFALLAIALLGMVVQFRALKKSG